MLWLLPALALGSVQDVTRCLDKNDVPCADAVLEGMNAETSTDPDVLVALARTHFYAGRYPEAHEAMQRAKKAGFEDPWGWGALYERTLYATAHWTEATRGRFTVRYKPGVDAVIVDQAFEALELTERNVTPLLGPSPPGTTLLEVFPDGYSFIAASSLTKDAVQTTGTVALSKWSRLLLTSPRALGRGYDWKDTTAHEYIHLVVAHATHDKAPVWLQEAIAKYLDSRWPDGRDHFRLDTRQKGLLAEALANDDLVTFAEMHPSLAMLPTADRAATAYAQLATLMAFCFEQGGEGVLLEALPKIRDGMPPEQALAEAAGYRDFMALEAAWERHLHSLDLSGKKLAELPTVLDGNGDDVQADPVLGRRDDLARYLRLGDLLRERDRPKAALVEYGQARSDDEPNSPLLANRIARAHLMLGEVSEAREILEDTLGDYPHFALSQKTLGEVYARQGERTLALEHYRNAADLNPYDPEVHQALVELFDAANNHSGKARHERLLRIIRRGGEDGPQQVIHDIVGEYELPRDEQPADKAEALERKLRHRRAPKLDWIDPQSGDPASIRDYEGKVVVLDFWATWCGPCKVAMPKLKAIGERHRDVVVIGVTDEDRSAVRRFLAKNDPGYTLGIASLGYDRYEVSALPTLFLIDRTGQIRDVHVGAGDLDAVGQAVEALVNEPAAQ